MLSPPKKQENDTAAMGVAIDILNSGVNIPPMSSRGIKLFKMIQRPVHEINTHDFCKLIEPDPGLYSKVLQLANSPHYKGVNEVITLRSAITRIGMDEAIASVNVYFLKRFLPKISDLQGFSANDYWAFSWACAVAARHLGHPTITQASLPGELYLAGLLQGIGKLVLALHYGAEFAGCIERAVQFEMPLQSVLMNEFGTTDTLLAAKLMGTWNIPEKICSAVQFCHNPELAPKQYQEIAGLTQLASRIASASQIGNSGDGPVQEIDTAWIIKSDASPISKAELRERIVEEILLMIHQKSDTITGVSVTETDEKKKPEHTKPNPQSIKKTKDGSKGFWKKILSLFR